MGVYKNMWQSKYLIPLAIGSTVLWGIARKIKRNNLQSYTDAPVEKAVDVALSGTLYGLGAAFLVGWMPLAAPILVVTTNVGTLSHVVHQTGLYYKSETSAEPTDTT